MLILRHEIEKEVSDNSAMVYLDFFSPNQKRGLVIHEFA